jgi:hypothetical protein
MWTDKNFKIDSTIKYLSTIIIICIIYIIFFTNLSFFYDWDTITRALWLKNGIYNRDAGVTHFLISILAGILVYVGIDPLNAFRILTSLFMLTFVIGSYLFAKAESKDDILAFMMSLFILFNLSYTILLTSLEDNIWLDSLLILFVYYLFLERWYISGFFLSLSILMHIQAEVFIPLLLLYISYKSNLSLRCEDDGILKNLTVSFSKSQMRKLMISLTALFIPLFLAYSYLILRRGWKLNSFVESFLASGPAYHGDAGLWFFASNRSIQDQIGLVYGGYVSTFISPNFICQYTDTLNTMPHAIYFGYFIAILIFYLLIRSFSFNLKTLCALPTFVILSAHLMVFEPWNIERWDFIPFFVMYFIVVGYNDKKYNIKNNIKLILSILVIFSLIFTFVSFNLLSGFQKGPIYAYSDELNSILDNDSVVIETTLDPESSFARYLVYECGDKVIFIKKFGYNFNNLNRKEIYTSNTSFKNLFKIFPDIIWSKELIWSNKIDDNISIIKIKPHYRLKKA